MTFVWFETENAYYEKTSDVMKAVSQMVLAYYKHKRYLYHPSSLPSSTSLSSLVFLPAREKPKLIVFQNDFKLPGLNVIKLLPTTLGILTKEISKFCFLGAPNGCQF